MQLFIWKQSIDLEWMVTYKPEQGLWHGCSLFHPHIPLCGAFISDSLQHTLSIVF